MEIAWWLLPVIAMLSVELYRSFMRKLDYKLSDIFRRRMDEREVEVKDEIDRKDKEIRQRKNDLNVVHEELAEKEAMILQLKNELIDSDQDVAEYKDQVNQLRAEYSEKYDEMVSAYRDIAARQKAEASLLEELARLEEVDSARAREIKELQSKDKTQQAEIARLQRDMAAQYKAYRENVALHQKETANCKQKALKAEFERDTRDQQFAREKEELRRDFAKKVESSMSEISLSRMSEIARLSNQVQKVQQEKTVQKQDFEKKTKVLNEVILRQRDNIKQLKQEKEDQKRDYEKKIAKTQNQHNELVDYISGGVRHLSSEKSRLLNQAEVLRRDHDNHIKKLRREHGEKTLELQRGHSGSISQLERYYVEKIERLKANLQAWADQQQRPSEDVADEVESEPEAEPESETEAEWTEAHLDDDDEGSGIWALSDPEDEDDDVITLDGSDDETESTEDEETLPRLPVMQT